MYKHGMKGLPIYNCWVAMKNRCYNPNHKNFKDYGGRGVKVCKEWLNPCNFFEWAESHGYREDLSLDRIDNEEGYTKTADAEHQTQPEDIIQGRNTLPYRVGRNNRYQLSRNQSKISCRVDTETDSYNTSIKKQFRA